MAKSDKTETSQDTESEKDTVTTEEVVEAEIVEESEADQDAPVIEDAPEADDEGLSVEEIEEVEEQVEDVTVPEAHDTPKPTKRGGFIPMVFGGVIAAGIGFGGATYMQSQGMLLGADTEALAAVEAKIAEQQAALEKLRSAQGDIAAKAESAVSTGADATALEARIDGLSERVETVAKDVIALGARLTEAEKRPMSEGLSASAIEAYEREVEQLRAQVAAQLAEAETLKANSEETARNTLIQAALTRVTAALDSGVPYEAALIDLANASGQSAPEALAGPAALGVVTLPALIDGFPEVARAALAEARKAESSTDTGSRIGAFLKAQLGARSVTPKEGMDPDAILSRAEAALKGGDIAAALVEIDTLPVESQAKMTSWREAAETRAAALAAADALALGLTD